MIARRFVWIPLLAALASAGELRFCLYSDPKTFDPLLVSDQNSETVRYLTSGTLLRLNRHTQRLEPELAQSWKLDPSSRRITFHLRRGLQFSDGTPFGAADVVYTLERMLDPARHAPIADAFRSGGAATFSTREPDIVTVAFSSPIANLAQLFDEVGLMSAQSPLHERAVLGPFHVAAYQPGVEVTLARNPHYWKTDAAGRRLPYAAAIHLYIQQNRQLEAARYLRGELDLINDVAPDLYEELSRKSAPGLRDLGPGLDTEMLWFNQASSAPVPDYRKAWFASTRFRRALSGAINRADLARVVYFGHATPAAGPVSPANRFWCDARLKPHPYDPDGSRRLLAADGFTLRGGVLRDRGGHPVEFSLVTNAGNAARYKMALMIQQDWQALGIRVHVTPLDFASLIERITRTFQYEACLLGLTNYDLDPSAMDNVWRSSGANHQWNPNQKSPATAWEAELDRLIAIESSSVNPARRKAAYDRVQEIASEQAPFIYLVHKDSLLAVGGAVGNSAPVPLRPQTFWNVEFLDPGKSMLARSAR